MAYLDVDEHGGGCCGIAHIRDFHDFRIEDAKRLKGIVKEESCREGGSCVLLEAVITEYQLRDSPTLKGALKKNNFRCVSRFRNRNSGNICYVYHHYTKV